MSLSACNSCWEDMCECGHKYKNMSEEWKLTVAAHLVRQVMENAEETVAQSRELLEADVLMQRLLADRHNAEPLPPRSFEKLGPYPLKQPCNCRTCRERRRTDRLAELVAEIKAVQDAATVQNTEKRQCHE